MTHREKIIISLMVAITVGWVANYFSLPHYAKAQSKESDAYWRGTVDQKLAAGEQKDQAIFDAIQNMRKDFRSICDDITEIKVRAAQNGALYGGGSGVAVYLITLLGGLVKRPKNGK